MYKTIDIVNYVYVRLYETIIIPEWILIIQANQQDTISTSSGLSWRTMKLSSSAVITKIKEKARDVLIPSQTNTKPMRLLCRHVIRKSFITLQTGTYYVVFRVVVFTWIYGGAKARGGVRWKTANLGAEIRAQLKLFGAPAWCILK